MAGLTKRQLAGKASYMDAHKDIPDAKEYADLTEEEREYWDEAAEEAAAAGNAPQEPLNPPAPPVPAAPVAAPAQAAAPQQRTRRAPAPVPAAPEEPAPTPPARCLTLRDLAVRIYEQSGKTGFDELSLAEKAKWDEVARTVNS